jgi:ubiquinol-cytochrome c reductase cytochrome b subunit
MPRPNKNGTITLGTKIRAALSRIYFEDRIAPVSKAEYELAHSEHAPAIETPKRKPKAIKSKQKQ